MAGGARRLAAILATVAALAAGGAAAAGPAAAQGGADDQPYSNPVDANDLPDPGVIRAGSLWWAAATMEAPGGMPLLSSPDLVHWTPRGSILSTPPSWADPTDMWAPEPVRWGASTLVYYSVRRRGGPFCVAVAIAANVAGPYRDGGPLTCQGAGGSIDPTVYPSWGTSRWLVYKEDGNRINRPTRIWARRLTADGLHLTGPRHLLFTARRRWQQGIVEAPELVRRNRTTYLFFSGGRCCSVPCSYAVGVARAHWLLGRFVEDPADPILAGGGDWRCPGHASIVGDDRDGWFVVYHAVRAAPGPFQRPLMLDRLRWGAGGWPTIDDGHGPSVQAFGPGSPGAAPGDGAPPQG